MARDWREERIAELERQNAELRAQLAAAIARISELEEKLRKSSRNSGKPPSSDTPAQTAERRKKAAAITKPGGRKPGGQPGHEKFTRQLVPPEQVAQHIDCIPERCERCNELLGGRDPKPDLHQVFHLPQIIPLVFQYARHALTCPNPGCGHVTVGKLPPGVPRGDFGPSVIAVMAFLIGVCRLGKRPVQAVMGGLFNLRVSLGAVIGCQDIASSALQSPVEEAKQAAQRAAVKHCDETSWRQGSQRAKVWLWTVVTKNIVVFPIHKERSTKAARALLGTSDVRDLEKLRRHFPGVRVLAV